MNLSFYVERNNTHYVNTVSLKILPLEATEQELGEQNFLAGQEEQALQSVLFENPKDLTLQVISTWECQLRCHHCFSHRRLVKTQNDETDVEKLADFVKRYTEKYPIKVTVNFLGGEPTLKTNLNLRIIKAIKALNLTTPLRFTMSTNLAKDLTDEDMEVFHQLNALQVSVDGTKAQHNLQRKVFLPQVYGITNAYEQTMVNVKKLLQEKIDFQIAAAISKEDLNVADKVEFFRNMLEAGVPFNHILYGHYFPTDHAKSSPGKEFIVPLVNPCCTFRFMRFIAVEHEEKLTADFYNDDGQLGNLSDPLELIEGNYKKFIMERMPVLHDPICRKCPFIGQCWGGCVGATYSKNKPSTFCDQANIDKVAERRSFIVNNVNEWYNAPEVEKNWNANHIN